MNSEDHDVTSLMKCPRKGCDGLLVVTGASAGFVKRACDRCDSGGIFQHKSSAVVNPQSKYLL
jgi:hypothetical protein